MKLKRVVLRLEDVEEQYRGLYQQGADGKFHLQAELDEDTAGLKTAIEKERETVKAMKKQLELFKDIDPEKYAKMEKELQSLEDKNLLDAGKIDELVAQRTERMRQSMDAQVQQLKEAADAKDKKLAELADNYSTLFIERGVMEAAASTGKVRTGAMPDILSRAKQVWRMGEDGKPAAFKGDGTPHFSADGKNPLAISEWVQSLSKEAPHLFEGSSGGGGGTPPSGKGAQLTAEQQNLSPQARLALARTQQMQGGGK